MLFLFAIFYFSLFYFHITSCRWENCTAFQPGCCVWNSHASLKMQFRIVWSMFPWKMPLSVSSNYQCVVNFVWINKSASIFEKPQMLGGLWNEEFTMAFFLFQWHNDFVSTFVMWSFGEDAYWCLLLIFFKSTVKVFAVVLLQTISYYRESFTRV